MLNTWSLNKKPLAGTDIEPLDIFLEVIDIQGSMRLFADTEGRIALFEDLDCSVGIIDTTGIVSMYFDIEGWVELWIGDKIYG